MKMVFPLITLCVWGGRAASGTLLMQAHVSLSIILTVLHPWLEKLSVPLLFFLSSASSTVRDECSPLWLYQAHAQLASHGRWELFWKHFLLHLITGAQRGGNMKQIRRVNERRRANEGGRAGDIKVFPLYLNWAILCERSPLHKD